MSTDSSKGKSPPSTSPTSRQRWRWRSKEEPGSKDATPPEQGSQRTASSTTRPSNEDGKSSDTPENGSKPSPPALRYAKKSEGSSSSKVGQSNRPLNGVKGEDLEVMTIRKAKALGMLRGGATIQAVVAMTGLSHSTVKRLKKGEHAVSESMIQALMGEEEKKLTMVQHRLVDSILEAPDEDIAKIPVNQKMVAAAIAIDKRELLAGRPTQRMALTFDTSPITEEIERLQRVLEDAGVTEADFEVVEDGELVGEATSFDD